MNDSPLSLLLTLSPLLATWLAGLALASARLRRHPEVSLLLMGGQAGMIASDVAGPVVFSVMLEPSSGADPIMLAIAFLGILAVQSAAWVATLVALFGWRADEQQASASDKFQFGLRSLLFVMFAAGVLSGMAAGAARLLLIPVIGFVSLAVQLPTFTALAAPPRRVARGDDRSGNWLCYRSRRALRLGVGLGPSRALRARRSLTTNIQHFGRPFLDRSSSRCAWLA
jgi:hypothetical protein